ncbi:MAG: hypothetical protein HFJ09_02080 [Lachnospiraceae bacterium]|nr:hypothetical protein [Lachnospiraceae bacterium]
MFTYLKMKKYEYTLKLKFYKMIVKVMNNQTEIKNFLELVQKLYSALKDVPSEELQKEFISNLAEIVHETNNNS